MSQLRQLQVIFTSLSVSDIAVGARRLEGEAYLTGGYAVRRAFERSKCKFDRLGGLAKIWYPGRLKGTKVSATDGIPFITATQVFDIRPTPRKWLAPSKIADVNSLRVKAGWILVTRSGSVGDAMVGYSAHESVITSDDLLRVVPLDAKLLGYIYCFLRSYYGRTMARSSQYGSIIKHLEPEHLNSIPVPVIPDKLAELADLRIRKVFQLRDRAFQMTRDAEDEYAKEIGVKLEVGDTETGYSVPASELFERRRLDGYHFNPDAEASFHALQKSKRPLEPLSIHAKAVFGVPRFKHIYARDGIPYLDSEDIFKINPEVTKFIPIDPNEKESVRAKREKYFVKRGWLLMASSGQIYGINGGVTLANEWHENKVVSNHVTRIVPRNEKETPPAGYIQMALGHPVLGRPLVLRCAFGTEVPEIAPADVLGLPIPRLPEGKEREISGFVQGADDLRREADTLENQTVDEIEQAVSAIVGLPPMDVLPEESPVEQKARPSRKHA